MPALKAIIQDNGFKCYPLCKVVIEKALKEEDGPSIVFFTDYLLHLCVNKLCLNMFLTAEVTMYG